MAGTIHSLCVVMLREHGERIGVPRGFGIADEAYQVQLLRRLGVYKWATSRLNDFSRHRLAGEELHPNSVPLLKEYQAWLAKRNLLDYDDLVIRAAQLLALPDVRAAIAGRWDAILVDECQDLNPVQYAVIKALAEGHRNLFAVGDDEQSIFSWAGAEPRVLRDLMNDFNITTPIVLEENRRSARAIFETARRLLKLNPTLFRKELRATRESEWGVETKVFDDDVAEAAWILADILRDRDGSGLPWGEYGVLYRKHELGSRIEGILLQAGVPCRLAAGRALQDDPVVQYLVAALRVISGAGRSGPRGGVRRGGAAGDAVPADPHRSRDQPRGVPRVAAHHGAAGTEGGPGDQEAPALPAGTRQPACAGAEAHDHQRPGGRTAGAARRGVSDPAGGAARGAERPGGPPRGARARGRTGHGDARAAPGLAPAVRGRGDRAGGHAARRRRHQRGRSSTPASWRRPGTWCSIRAQMGPPRAGARHLQGTATGPQPGAARRLPRLRGVRPGDHGQERGRVRDRGDRGRAGARWPASWTSSSGWCGHGCRSRRRRRRSTATPPRRCAASRTSRRYGRRSGSSWAATCWWRTTDTGSTSPSCAAWHSRSAAPPTSQSTTRCRWHGIFIRAAGASRTWRRRSGCRCSRRITRWTMPAHWRWYSCGWRRTSWRAAGRRRWSTCSTGSGCRWRWAT